MCRYSVKKKGREKKSGYRSIWGSFMVRHNLIREEVDLLQGRVPKSLFIRHYWTPNFAELKDRTLKALTQLEKSL
jgi:hypothetical protein